MKIKLNAVRLSFPQLFEAKTVNGEGKPAFSAAFLISPKDPQIAMINTAISTVAAENGREPSLEVNQSVVNIKADGEIVAFVPIEVTNGETGWPGLTERDGFVRWHGELPVLLEQQMQAVSGRGGGLRLRRRRIDERQIRTTVAIEIAHGQEHGRRCVWYREATLTPCGGRQRCQQQEQAAA